MKMAGDRMAREENAAVAVYPHFRAAGTAIQRLKESGFEMDKVSVAARDERSGNQVTGYYRGNNGMCYWGRLGQFWGPLWGLLSGWAFFAVPGLGPVLVAGPLAGWIVALLENAAIFGGLTVVGAGLYNIGVAKQSVLECEAALREGKYVVLVHGAGEDVRRARQLLNLTEDPLPQRHEALHPAALSHTGL
jgi:hypothetical protein